MLYTRGAPARRLAIFTTHDAGSSAMDAPEPELIAIWIALLIALSTVTALLLRLSFLLAPIKDLMRTLLCVLETTFGGFLIDLYRSAVALPFAWYSMAILTVVPICVTVPRDGAVVFLGIYCAAGLLVCSLDTRRKNKNKQPSGLQAQAAAETFMGMRIKIELL